MLFLVFLLHTMAGMGQNINAHKDSLTVYLFPGLGLDERVFDNLHLPYKVKHIEWRELKKKETLPQYALRLAQQIDTTQAYSLIGMSFGGMIVSEIVKQYQPKHAILISSAKSSEELPRRVKFLRFLPFHRLLQDKGSIKAAYALRKVFGVRGEEQSKLFKDMLHAMPDHYFPRAIDAIVKWDSKEVPASVAHLHGDADLILPFSEIKAPYRIEDGTHFMVYTQTQKLNDLLLKLLAQ